MPFTTSAKNLMLDALPNSVFVSGHTALPDNSGSNEITGGTYARKSIPMAAANAANRDSTAEGTIDIPAGTTVTHLGYWTAATGGTFLGFKAIAAETYSNPGTLTVTDLDFNLVDA